MSVELTINATGVAASGKTYYLQKILEFLEKDERYSMSIFEEKRSGETLWIRFAPHGLQGSVKNE